MDAAATSDGVWGTALRRQGEPALSLSRDGPEGETKGPGGPGRSIRLPAGLGRAAVALPANVASARPKRAILWSTGLKRRIDTTAGLLVLPDGGTQPALPVVRTRQGCPKTTVVAIHNFALPGILVKILGNLTGNGLHQLARGSFGGVEAVD